MLNATGGSGAGSTVGEWLSKMNGVEKAWDFLRTVLPALAITAFLLWLARIIFRKHLKSGSRIHIRLIENLFKVIVILIAVFWVIRSNEITAPLGKIVFQGTAVLAAIIGFASQPVISDVICGFILSASKPFELGDRIELEDGTRGVVKDFTIRHVVIHKLDTLDIYVPNSKINAMEITNMSRGTYLRAIHLTFSIGYDSDVELAMKVIRQAVEESEYTVPGYPGKAGIEYGPVYFTAYADSSLKMETTVYYEPSSPSEVVNSDIHCRVNRLLKENNIEIPYPYVNVVHAGERKEAPAQV